MSWKSASKEEDRLAVEAAEFYCLHFLQGHLTARASKRRWLKSLVIGNKSFHDTAVLNTPQIRMGKKMGLLSNSGLLVKLY